MRHLCTFLICAGLFTSAPLVPAQELMPASRLHRDTLPRPVILDIIQAVHQDSLAANMRSLENMGTRYQYAENRKQVAEWIAAKFQSYGVTRVELDSFKLAGDTILTDSVWQYNVVATLEGTTAPHEIYILGAHHDDYSDTNLYLYAPGANDNASGCAVALEVARVFHEKNFLPASTIRLVTFAAEELTGYKQYSGSIYYADKINASGEDLRLMINNDMVAHTTGSSSEIKASFIESEQNRWAGELTLLSAELYSSLNVIPSFHPTTDAMHFWELGYCVAGFEEFGLPWTYHTIYDSVSNCDMGLCENVARTVCAVLMYEQLTPVPQELTCSPGKQSVTLSWKPTLNHHVAGFRIYRSTSPDTGFQQLDESTGPTNQYTDTTLSTGKIYYYRVTSFDQDNFESLFSNTIHGALMPLDRELLVVKDSKGGLNNPPDSSVMGFYQKIFQDLNPEITDASVTDSLDLAVLGRYQKICWLSNTYSNQPGSSFRTHEEDILIYLQCGGQLFLSAFQPSFLIAGNTSFNKTFSADQPVYRYYKIASVERKPSAFLNGAFPAGTDDYDTLHIDPAKCPDPPEGHVPNVECINPAPGATLIYRFNSAFDSTTTQGVMKGKPVGLEYLGTGHKVIILSVPLFYLDTADAESLVNLVVKEKFTSSIGTEERYPSAGTATAIHIYPNPSSGLTTIGYTLSSSSEVSLEIISLIGKRVFCDSGWQSAGYHPISLPADNFLPGIYLIILKTSRGSATGKLVIL